VSADFLIFIWSFNKSYIRDLNFKSLFKCSAVPLEETTLHMLIPEKVFRSTRGQLTWGDNSSEGCASGQNIYCKSSMSYNVTHGFGIRQYSWKDSHNTRKW
jgi:hypothetical protein